MYQYMHAHMHHPIPHLLPNPPTPFHTQSQFTYRLLSCWRHLSLPGCTTTCASIGVYGCNGGKGVDESIDSPAVIAGDRTSLVGYGEPLAAANSHPLLGASNPRPARFEYSRCTPLVGRPNGLWPCAQADRGGSEGFFSPQTPACLLGHRPLARSSPRLRWRPRTGGVGGSGPNRPTVGIDSIHGAPPSRAPRSQLSRESIDWAATECLALHLSPNAGSQPLLEHSRCSNHTESAAGSSGPSFFGGPSRPDERCVLRRSSLSDASFRLCIAKQKTHAINLLPHIHTGSGQSKQQQQLVALSATHLPS